MRTSSILEEALALPSADRGELAARLIASLDDDEEVLSREEWEAAWSVEIARRLAAMDAGQAVFYPAEDVLAELEAALEEKTGRG